MKSLKKFGFAVIVTAMLFGLASCGNNAGETPTPEPAPTEIPHEHTYETKWQYDKEYHWHYSDCDHKEYASCLAKHTLEDVTGLDVTCTVNGRIDTKCSVCGFVDHETTVYAVGHIWGEGADGGSGIMKYKCKNCAEELLISRPSLELLGSYKELKDDELESYGITASSFPPKIADATYVTFGTWPQTVAPTSVVVDESTTIEAGGHTYCLGTDGGVSAWYYKCKENSNDANYKYSDGTSAKKSDQDSYRWFKVEPILWRVLTDDYDSGKTLLVAESVLTANVQFYGTDSNRTLTVNGEAKTIYPNNWKYSNVRAWLNGTKNQFEIDGGTAKVHDIDWTDKGFLQTAFTENQKTRIHKNVTIKNDDASTKSDGSTDQNKNQYSCDDTIDTVFLLSVQEGTTKNYGFSTEYIDKHKMRKSSDFSIANNVYSMSSVGAGYWWLRSPHNSIPHYACRALDGVRDGPVDESIGNSPAGVVPALCVTK